MTEKEMLKMEIELLEHNQKVRELLEGYEAKYPKSPEVKYRLEKVARLIKVNMYNIKMFEAK